MRAAWLVAVPLIWAVPCRAQVTAVTVQPPSRDFGIFVGDLLTSIATLQVQPGTTLDARSLPPQSAVAPDIDLRAVQITGTATRIEIRTVYQSFFSPDQVLQETVPGYTVTLFAHGQRLSAAIPGFAFTASPFRHDLQPVLDPAALRPDHPPGLARAPSALAGLAVGAAAAMCGVLLLALPLRRSRAAPFRLAARRLAALRRDPPPDAAQQALLAVHRAFDSTDGARLFAADIDGFLGRHSQFLPLRDRIAAFFDTSRTVFFGPAGSAPDLATCSALCRDLARAEARA